MGGVVVSDVVKRFGATTALKGVSIRVEPGEFVALLGPSGCGKTTLLRIIAGIERADSGTIQVGERDVTRLRAADRDIAMVFQSYALYPHLTAAQNIAVPLLMRRLSAWQRLPLVGRFMPGSAAARHAMAQDVARAAENLGLAGLLDRKPGQLSGGQRQRVALARAIVRSPRAFLMDEPLSNLDAALRVQTRREIVDIHRRVGAATVYVTHDQTEALTMADRVAVMLSGEILQVDAPERIYAEPADLRVATFIGSPRINTVPAEIGGDGAVRVAGVAVGLGAPGAPGAATLAIRPEDLRPDPHGPIDAVAEHLEFLGDSLLLHAQHTAGGGLMTLRLPPGAALPAAGFRCAFTPSRALLFGQDGRRRPLSVTAPAHV